MLGSIYHVLGQQSRPALINVPVMSLTQLIVKKVLKQFNKKPQALVSFRDGVSEGHFTTVRARELMTIRAACRELQLDYEP